MGHDLIFVSTKPAAAHGAIFGYLASTAKHAGLDGGQIHAAELQKLPLMMEPPQVPGLGQDRQSVDRPDAGNGAQQLIVMALGQQFDRPIFDDIALADQASPFGLHHADHSDGV